MKFYFIKIPQMKKIIGAVLFVLTTNVSTAQIQNNFEQRELFMMDQLTKAVDPLSNINQYEQGFCSSCNKEDPVSDSKKRTKSRFYLCRIHNKKLGVNSNEFNAQEQNKK